VSLLLASAELFDAVGGLVVFVLASFVGFEVITRVPTLLHTPLMSGSNAISGIVVVGGIVVAGYSQSTLAALLALVAVAAAMANVVGGFLVTDRMLKMFRGKPAPSGKPKAGA
jgi:H+-translocating NAD(P) transhydrogenase subunit alpha